MQLVEQYLAQAAIKLPSSGATAFNARSNLSGTVLGAPARTVLQ